VRIGLIKDTLTKMVSLRELASRYSIAAPNTVENTKVVIAMELLKQSTLTPIFAGECSKTVKQMDILHISTRVETHTLGSTKMERKMVMAYSNGLMEQHITGSGMKVKEMDTESISFLTIMSTMANGKTARDQEKQWSHTLKQEKFRENFRRMTSL
jgi:hypothetical protein